MELITYVHSELAFDAANNGIEIAPALNCHTLEQLKQTTRTVALVGCAGVVAASLTVGGLAHAQATTSSTSTATVTTGSVVSTTTTATQSSTASSDVAEIQTLLARRGFEPGAIDGIKGPQTESAILRAQAFYNLSQDGIAGTQTLAALETDQYETATPDSDPNPDQTPDKNKDNEKPDPTSDAKPSAAPLTPEEIAANQQIQALLKDRGFYSGAIDGIAGAKTKAAIRQAQSVYNLNVDGIAGPQTVAALEKDSPSSAEAAQPTASPAATNADSSTATIVPSSTVTEAQKLMSELGFYQGAIDGIQGPATTTAVKRAQAFYGLSVDGVIGEATLKSLRA